MDPTTPGAALGVSTDQLAELLDGTERRAVREPGPATLLPSGPPASWAARIEGAVRHPVDAARRAASAGPVNPGAVRAAVDQAMRVSLASGYPELDRVLPDLIGQAEVAGADDEGRRPLSDVAR